VLELLAVVHALRVFRHYLLGSSAPRPPGTLSDFTLRTDNQAVSWLRTKREVNRFLARWLDEIEEFRFEVEHVPGRLNPADPLTRRGWPQPMARDPVTAEELGTGPVTATSPPPATAAAAVVTPGSATADPPPAIAAAAVVTPGPATAGPGAVFTPLTGARVQLLTGGVTVPPNPSQPERHFLAPTFIARRPPGVRRCPRTRSLVPSSKAPLLRSAGRSTAMDTRSLPRQVGRRAVLSSFVAACSTAGAKGRQIGSAYRMAGVCDGRFSRNVTTPLWVDTSAGTRRLRWFVGSPSGRDRRGTWKPTYARARFASAPRPTTWAPAAFCTPSPYPHVEAG
jgi:hypothetical protein